jgi:DNA-binding NarL/FixJ family response regulator
MTMAARRIGNEPKVPLTPPVRMATFRCGDKRFAVVGVPRDDEHPLTRLSAAEHDVALMATAGLTNAAIAKRRHTAVRTVANQMASILRKLGLSSRYDLAAHVGSPPSGKAPR